MWVLPRQKAFWSLGLVLMWVKTFSAASNRGLTNLLLQKKKKGFYSYITGKSNKWLQTLLDPEIKISSQGSVSLHVLDRSRYSVIAWWLSVAQDIAQQPSCLTKKQVPSYLYQKGIRECFDWWAQPGTHVYSWITMAKRFGYFAGRN